MATEAAQLEAKELTGRKKKNRLDTHRPSHGRTWRVFRKVQLSRFLSMTLVSRSVRVGP